MERAREIRTNDTASKNCSQTVLRVYAEELGFDEKLAAGLAAQFGGGMRTGNVCGAVTGALMVLGAAGVENPDAAKELIRRFKEKNGGMLNCKDLLAANAAAGGDKHEHCSGKVYEAVGILDELLEKYKAGK